MRTLTADEQRCITKTRCDFLRHSHLLDATRRAHAELSRIWLRMAAALAAAKGVLADRVPPPAPAEARPALRLSPEAQLAEHRAIVALELRKMDAEIAGDTPTLETLHAEIRRRRAVCQLGRAAQLTAEEVQLVEASRALDVLAARNDVEEARLVRRNEEFSQAIAAAREEG